MNVNKMTPYERTIQFLNDMGIKYEECINEACLSYPYKSRYVEMIGYTSNEKDIFCGTYNGGVSIIFSLNGCDLLGIMPTGE